MTRYQVFHRRTLFVTCVLVVSVLCVFKMSKTVPLEVTRKAHLRRQDPLKNPVFTLKARPSTSMAVNNRTLKKIDEMLKDLNQTRNEAFFPAEVVDGPILMNSEVCKETPIINIITMVYSAPTNFEKRQRIRATYANKTLYFPLQVRVVFLLGKAKKPDEQMELATEHAQYGDTVMGDFYDDYKNLTLKGVFGLRWVAEYCSNSDVVVKIDDDAILNVYKLGELYLDNMAGKTKSFFCNIWHKNMDIMRGGKWGLPFHLFPGQKFFPYYYCSGLTVVFTSDMASLLYNAAKITPFFWISDLYLFGMLPKVVGGVTYHDYKYGKYMTLREREFANCLNESGDSCNIFCSLVTSSAFLSHWKTIQHIHNRKSWHDCTVFQS